MTLKRKWRAALVDDGFLAHGIHWTDLAGGYDHFRHLAGPDKKGERERIQRKYIAIIRRSVLKGFSARFDVAESSSALPVLSKFYVDKNPYLFAFDLAINRLCLALRQNGWLQEAERMAFVFDRKNGIQGRARTLFNLLAELPVRHAKHLGTLTFADSKEFLPIQAADALANEIKREADRGQDIERRWQYVRMMDGKQVWSFEFTRELFVNMARKASERYDKDVAASIRKDGDDAT